MPLTVKPREVGDVTVVDILIRASYPGGFLPTIEKLMADGRKKLVLNLSKYDSLNALDLGDVVRSHLRACGVSASLKVLVDPRSRLPKIFRVTKLDTVIEVFDDEKQAVSSFSA